MARRDIRYYNYLAQHGIQEGGPGSNAYQSQLLRAQQEWALSTPGTVAYAKPTPYTSTITRTGTPYQPPSNSGGWGGGGAGASSGGWSPMTNGLINWRIGF
jgi:hypothetical protein